jgi:hypothetical protein
LVGLQTPLYELYRFIISVTGEQAPPLIYHFSKWGISPALAHKSITILHVSGYAVFEVELPIRLAIFAKLAPRAYIGGIEAVEGHTNNRNGSAGQTAQQAVG